MHPFPSLLTRKSPAPAVAEPACPSASRPAWYSAGWGFVHLLTLNAFVVAQPLFDRLQRNTGYLAQEQITPWVMAVVTAVLLTGLPLMWLAIRLIAARFRPRLTERVHLAAVFVYTTSGFLLLFEKATENFYVKQLGLPAVLVVPSVAASAWWVTRRYRTNRWMGATLSVASVGAVVFPTLFWFSQPVSAVLFPRSVDGAEPIRAGNPVPIVVVVFDGLNGMALLDESHQIDGVRYPNFARLAGLSDWFRNATTVHPRTDNAVPALLTGRYPEPGRLAVLSEHPDNLFTFLLRTGQYEMSVFEPFTRLCPQRLRDRPRAGSAFGKAIDVIGTLAAVYGATILPPDLGIPQPDIPRAWFRLPEALEVDDSFTTGLFIYSWDQDRAEQIDHFLRCLQPSSRPALRYLHVMLPHYPWAYLPSGKRYVEWITASEYPLGTHGKFGEDWGPDPLAPENAWRRYLLQLQYADRQLGRILDHLQATGQMDKSLMIVTADHGESFVPNFSRRMPTPSTLPDLMPIPLFVKRPHQSQGHLSDQNVELVDVLPTIADVVDLELPVPLDGDSLLRENDRPRLRKTLFVDESQIVVDGSFPQRFEYTDRMIRQFGSGGSIDRLETGTVLPELVGRDLGDIQTTAADGPPLKLHLVHGPADSAHAVSDRQFVPSLIEGAVENVEARPLPITIAVAVNGKVAGVTRTLKDPDYRDAFSILLPESAFYDGQNDLRIFEVKAEANDLKLAPCSF